MRGYDMFRKIEDESELATIFNIALQKLNMTRIITAPKDFTDKQSADIFYETCLWEMYLNAVIERLKLWIKVLDEYETEFMSSWEYYAAAKRIESINEYGGEEEDYNQDGTVKTVGISNKALKIHSVINDLVFDEIRDIVQDTEPKHLYGLVSFLEANAKFSLTDMFKSMGKDLPAYKQDGNGNMVQVTFADRALMKASNEADADNLSEIILYTCTEMNEIIGKIRKLNKCRDNKSELMEIKQRIKNLYKFDVKQGPHFR